MKYSEKIIFETKSSGKGLLHIATVLGLQIYMIVYSIIQNLLFLRFPPNMFLIHKSTSTPIIEIVILMEGSTLIVIYPQKVSKVVVIPMNGTECLGIGDALSTQ